MMSENWNSYICNVNGKLASIAIDLEAGKQAAGGNKTWLLWVWVYLQSPRADGLSDAKEFETICAIDEELTKQISAACDGINVGRITTDERREFYYYGAHQRDPSSHSEDGFKAAVSRAMSNFSGYRFDLGAQKDVEWNQYFKVLYPSDEELQKMKNRDVIDVLAKNGDIPEAVRMVEHWIYFASGGDRDWYASKVQELGYSTGKHIVENNTTYGNRPFGLVASRQQDATPESIDAAVLELFRLAKQINAEYDGWETQVVTSETR
jgi:uncharacterized protein (TIGR01619 family)